MSAETYCSFCGRNTKEVDVMIAGPAIVFICSECVEMCVGVVAKK